ncbi:MAG: aldo/keto reductase [Bdellovibrionota bacterium]
MSDFSTSRVLGRSGLVCGRLGLASSYGGSPRGFEAAFEQGCNYFYWGSMRRKGMGDAIKTIASRKREKLTVVLQTYSRVALLTELTLKKGLRDLKLDYADVLLLGWYNKKPSEGFLEKILKLKEKGLFRKLAISCHDRPTFREYISDARFDLIMLRYNAAHRGAEREVFPFLDQTTSKPGVVSYTATRWSTLIDPKLTPKGLKTPTAVDCYRFALSNPHVDLCLTGPATDAQLEDNMKALRLGPLSPDEMSWIKEVGDHVHKLTSKKVFTNPFMQRHE